MIARSLLLGLILSFSLGSLAKPQRAKGSKNITVAVLDTGPANPHEKMVLALFKRELRDCPACKVKSFSLYDVKGDLVESQMLSQLRQAAKQGTFIHLSWNLRMSPAFAQIVQTMRELTKKGVLIVASAGAPSDQESITAPLTKTVMGQVPNAFLIGELNEKGNLPSHAYYGPEMFTALQPPEGYTGSSFSAVLFSAKLAQALAQGKSVAGMAAELRSRKARALKSYPSLQELY